jgi:hypothetical protein
MRERRDTQRETAAERGEKERDSLRDRERVG